MRVVSYNCRGLRIGNSAGDRARRVEVDILLRKSDILCLQETFLSKQDLGGLNCVHDDFHGAGESTTDLSQGIIRGRIPGGVAILWHKRLDSVVNVVRLETDWCIGVQVRMNNKEFIILNVYTPYEASHNDDEYVYKLSFINSFIADNCCTTVLVVGDMNADISDISSPFAKHMLRMCDENNLVLSSQLLHLLSRIASLIIVRPTEQQVGLIM